MGYCKLNLILSESRIDIYIDASYRYRNKHIPVEPLNIFFLIRAYRLLLPPLLNAPPTPSVPALAFRVSVMGIESENKRGESKVVCDE